MKWVGGKRQIISEIQNLLPKKITSYYEPFIGGGAVLFHIQPQRATINDLNAELINLYRVIKEQPSALIKDLSKHKNEAEYFYQIRSLDRDKEQYSQLTEVERASRIIYLNKTCYNGLFRVNNAGEFNTPFSAMDRSWKEKLNRDTVKLTAVSSYLNQAHVSILQGDFEASLQDIPHNAFVYFDPPYDPVSDSASFTGYTQGGFNRQEQIRLKRICDELHEKDIKFLLSNSCTDFILDLYRDYQINKIKANRFINSNAEKRGMVSEVLIRNYE